MIGLPESSGKASRTRRAASGVDMTIAAADPSRRRMRRSSSCWCSALGKTVISSSAHGSPRSATHGRFNSSDSRFAANADSYGDIQE